MSATGHGDNVLDRRLRAWAAAPTHEIAVLEVKDDIQSVSRRELADRAWAAAAAFRRHGVGADSLVALDGHNDARTFAACIGAWAVGATVLLFDPALPREALKRRVEASPWRARPTVFARDWVANPETTVERAVAAPPEPAVVLATGGSTGRPRLVPGPLSLDGPGLEAYALLLRRANWNEGHRQLVSGPFFHAAPMLHSMVGLLQGNTLVCLPRFEPRLFRDVVVELAVDWCQLTPYQMQRIAALRELDGSDLAPLKGVLHTAAPCSPSLKRRWLDLLGPERLFELYSSTEAIGTTLVSGVEWLERPGTVGRGFATRIRIVRDDGGRAGVGEVGSVYMRSSRAAAMRRLAAAGVVQATPDGYATVGDRGYLDSDGYLYLAGRTDHVVNVGGVKVDAKQVEDVLAAHPAVVDVAVLSTPSRRLGQRLVAFIEADEVQERGTIRAWCQQRLPPAACPSIRLVPVIPRTAAGKVDREALLRSAEGGESIGRNQTPSDPQEVDSLPRL